ncbi:hypothetical protein [Deefgea rivuli]|uniref:hypothetical protein n=1 Tax=Deefgea rivuli TaxID=400948 RepID=UPI0004871D20|nr:hypothetical protein [Deefgea rivuli]
MATMQTVKYSFYPAQPYWAINAVDLSLTSEEFSASMSEIVYSFNQDEYTVEFSRDGLISISRDEKYSTNQLRPEFEDTIQKLKLILNYINALNLIFCCEADRVDQFSYFHLQIVNNRDLFVDELQCGKLLIGYLPKSGASNLFECRYKNMHSVACPIEFDPRFIMRRIVSRDALLAVQVLFSNAVKNKSTIIYLSFLAKSLAEYKNSALDHSLVLSWFVTESIVSDIYTNQLKRNKRDYACDKINELKKRGKIKPTLFNEVEKTRKKRNDIAHATMSTCISSVDSKRSIENALALIFIHFKIDLRVNFGQSVLGM